MQLATRMVTDADLLISLYVFVIAIIIAITAWFIWRRHREERFARAVFALLAVTAGSTLIAFPATFYMWSHHAIQPTFSLNLIGISRLIFTTAELLVVLFILVPEDRG